MEQAAERQAMQHRTGTLDDPSAVWNLHGLHPGSVWTTFRTGMGWGLPALPDLTLAEAPGKRRLRLVAISDTHNKHDDLVLPPGDVLIHGGDCTWGGTLKEVEAFNAWLGTLPHEHKIVVAGNHDFAFDPQICEDEPWKHLHKYHGDDPLPKMTGRDMAAKYLTNCIYLCEESVTIDGVQIYATPHQETIHVIDHKMAFNLDTEEQLAGQFAKMPETADVLLTLGPPKGVGRLDRMIAGVSVGSSALAERIKQLDAAAGTGRLKFCVFGHVHEGYGVSAHGRVACINAASVDMRYRAAHPPIVFDVPVP